MIGAYQAMDIVAAAERCEFWLNLQADATAYDDPHAAADYAARAEGESKIAFFAAGLRSTWTRQRDLFPPLPPRPAPPCRGVAGAGGDLSESGRAGAF